MRVRTIIFAIATILVILTGAFVGYESMFTARNSQTATTRNSSEVSSTSASPNSTSAEISLVGAASGTVNNLCATRTTQPSLVTPSDPPVSRFSLNESLALNFYAKSSTNLGFEEEYPNSSTVYLADTQGLDYYSLLGIYQDTNDSLAFSLAEDICQIMQHYGGVVPYWNPSFEAVGDYGPYGFQTVNGSNFSLGTILDGNHSLRTFYTTFTPNSGFDYREYADQIAYRVILDVKYGNYTFAERDFGNLSELWNGHGFVDSSYVQSKGFQSYKLAVFLIAWDALLNNTETRGFALNYSALAQNVSSTMSALQDPVLGGVATSYFFDNGAITVNFRPINENGETTSLFEIAWRLGL